MSDPDYKPGDWVVGYDRGGQLVGLVHDVWSVRGFYQLDRPWPGQTHRAILRLERPATPDEIAAACMASPEGTL